MIETPGSALVVIPHPDDGEGWCGGTVAKWVKDGAVVYYVLCTDGGKGSNDPEMTSEQLAAIREKEQLDAASVLGVSDVVLLRHPDGDLEDTAEFRKEIVRAVRRFRPDVVLCPESYKRNSYWHRDHRITGQVTADAVFPYARDHLHFQELSKDEGLEPHKTGMLLFWNPDLPDVFIDIGDAMEMKARALLCHDSQMGQRRNRDVGESVRERARQSAGDSGFEYAEAFRKLEFRR
jgi:LmbE family N-acetylglucosaminyl deacetylase